MMRVWWLVLAGCNSILGLDPATERPADAPPPQLLYPPADAGPCTTPPDLTNLAFEETITVTIQVSSITMYRLSGADGMILARVDPSANGSILDWDLASTPQTIAALTPPAGVRFDHVASSPDGAALWIQLQGGALSLAVRAQAWAQQRPDFGFPPTTTVVLGGSVGYYGGTARMVLEAQAVTENKLTLVEVSSRDGETWTHLDTVKLATGAAVIGEAKLSADGCVLTYDDGPGVMHVSYRDANGNFTTVADISSPPYPEAQRPTMSADQRDLWFVVPSDVPPQHGTLVRGHH